MSENASPEQHLTELTSRRQAVRLTTVYGGRISQFGKAYACTVSDISVGGAKVKLKDPRASGVLVKGKHAQLVFGGLSEYKSLNGELAGM